MLLLMAGGIAGGWPRSSRWCWRRGWPKGWAAGIVQPIPAIIMMRAFQPHEQGRASGVFGMGVVLAPALGPSIAACWWTCSAGVRSSSWWCLLPASHVAGLPLRADTAPGGRRARMRRALMARPAAGAWARCAPQRARVAAASAAGAGAAGAWAAAPCVLVAEAPPAPRREAL
jgi:hypothetical protein